MTTTTTHDRAAMYATMSAVAPLLGAGWSMQAPEYAHAIGDLHGPGYASISVGTVSGTPGRLVLRGSFERLRDTYGRDAQSPYSAHERVSITVAASRSALEIAGEIVRRVLPPYLTALVKMEEASAQAQQSHQNRDALVRRLCAIGGMDVPKIDPDGERYVTLRPPPGQRLWGHRGRQRRQRAVRPVQAEQRVGRHGRENYGRDCRTCWWGGGGERCPVKCSRLTYRRA